MKYLATSSPESTIDYIATKPSERCHVCGCKVTDGKCSYCGAPQKKETKQPQYGFPSKYEMGWI